MARVVGEAVNDGVDREAGRVGERFPLVKLVNKYKTTLYVNKSLQCSLLTSENHSGWHSTAEPGQSIFKSRCLDNMKDQPP